jgi:hypothetical protein
LFQQRIAGDDALLKLARLRFAQAGLAAEVYADTPDQLERALRFAPPHPRLPLVHLNRNINLLDDAGRAVVEEFARRFAGRVSGLVVHDKAQMATQGHALVAGIEELDISLGRRPDSPLVFLEYAAGLEPGCFVELVEQFAKVERVSCCLDVGHVGIKQAGVRFSREHPDVKLWDLSPDDDRLPDLVGDVQRAVEAALPIVLDMIRALAQLGKRLHFHLHDGHPIIRGLSDHFSFLMRVPVPFSHDGRQSLPTMYGPAGLAAIVSTAMAATSLEQLSFTLEIHQVEGRLPLEDAAGLFKHWRDTSNAERMNYWLSVLANNGLLVDTSMPISPSSQ